MNTLRWGRGAPGLVPPPSRTFRPRVTSSSSHLLLDLVRPSRSLASASPSLLRPNSDLPGGLRIRLCLRPPELLPGPHVIIPGPRAKGHLLTEGSLDQPTERWPLYPASHCSMPQPAARRPSRHRSAPVDSFVFRSSPPRRNCELHLWDLLCPFYPLILSA